MNTWDTFVTGFDPDHLPAFWAGVLYALAVYLIWLLRRPAPRAPLPDRIAGHLLADSAAIHLALPIGHHDDATLTVLFLASGAVYGWLGWRAITGRRYRVASAILIVATLAAYLKVVGGGGEGADQVGIITALLELVALGICLTPARRAPVRQTFGAIAFVLTVVVSGGAIWATSLATHLATESEATVAAADDHGGARAGVAAGPAHDHGGTADGHQHSGSRAQAGVIMRPVENPEPTAAQQAAAVALADRTRASLARYTDIRSALAAGYRPGPERSGLRVHLENKAFQRDGRILDPDRPELLMYAIADGRATLLGAVFQMPRAGEPGPAPGGPLTQWHAHDVCLTLLPPGLTVVSAYGTCPLLSVSVTIGEMMHVWTIDHPGGPFNDDAPDSWIRAYNLAHGIRFAWG